MRIQQLHLHLCGWLAGAMMALAAPPAQAHDVNIQSIALQACQAGKLADPCHFTNHSGDVY
ncbi:MAG: hypothetical protein WA888_18935, partial [Burkholderiaceae bacterium]